MDSASINARIGKQLSLGQLLCMLQRMRRVSAVPCCIAESRARMFPEAVAAFSAL